MNVRNALVATALTICLGSGFAFAQAVAPEAPASKVTPSAAPVGKPSASKTTVPGKIAAPGKTAAPGRTAAPATKTPATTTAAGKPRTAVSLKCSEEADSQKLTGKMRKKFRSNCKRGK